MFEATLFSIDNGNDLRTMKKFLRYVDGLLATDALKGNVVPCIGMWKGRLEDSFIMLSSDFELVRGWAKDQDCILRISSDPKQPVVAEYEDFSEVIGYSNWVEPEEAFKHDGWTYRKDTGRYFVIKPKGNYE